VASKEDENTKLQKYTIIKNESKKTNNMHYRVDSNDCLSRALMDNSRLHRGELVSV